MSTPHVATPEQWSQIEGYAAIDLNDDYASCLLDIRARVEALEEAENDRRFEQAKAIIDKPAPAPASSLVELVANALAESDHPHQLWHDDARAAIREVAAWLRDRGGYPWAWVAQTLEQEANR